MWHQLYSKHTNVNTSSMLTQLSFLTSLMAQLRDSPGDVVAAMNRVRESLTRTENLRVFVAANVSTLLHPRPLKPWKDLPLQPR